MRELRELHLFAGAGGGILSSILLGHEIIGAVEINEYCCKVLEQRQKDGVLPSFPIFQADIRDFNRLGYADLYKGRCDILSGGFPCTDISAAGKGAGIEGKQSGLWKEMARTIRIIQPRYVFVENSPMLTSRGLGVVLGDLAEMGMDARWGVLSACAFGAPQVRKRLWIVAGARGWFQWEQRSRVECEESGHRQRNLHIWAAEPRDRYVADGVADRLERAKSSGNGQVPIVAASAWRILSGSR